MPELPDSGSADIYNSLILLVDDHPDNLKFLRTLVKRTGFRLAVCSKSNDVLTLLREQKIDLILMDTQVQGMDALDVCKRIKADILTEDIPIILFSDKSDSRDRVVGLEAGAMDYIAKPFDSDEVRVRIKTQLRIKKSKDVLRCYHKRLETLVDKQANELIRMEREAAFSLVTQGVVHNMNNPLASIFASAELLQTYLTSLPAGNTSKKNNKKLRSAIDLNKIVLKGSMRLSQMVDNLMVRGRENHLRLQKESFDLNETIDKECRFFREYHLKKHTNLSFKSSDKGLNVFMVKSEFLQVINNLLQNAQDALHRTGGEIRVSVHKKNANACINVSDSGNGIGDELLPLIFDPFFTTKSRFKNNSYDKSPQGTGLGLYYCAQIIEAYEGKIDVQSVKDKPTSFSIYLPLYKPEEN